MTQKKEESMKVIDVHTHVFPDDVADEYIEHYAAHSGLSAVCRPTIDGLFAAYEGIDLAKCVALPEWEGTRPFESKDLRFAAESATFYEKCYFYTYNEWLGKVQKEHERLICFGGVHPDDPDCAGEFERMVGRYGLSGMKLVPCMQHFYLNDRRLFPIYERAAQHKIPVLVHTGGDPVFGREVFGHPHDMDEVASAFPKLTVIMAHMGIPFFEETKQVMKRHPNVHTDISFTVSFGDVHSFATRHGMDTSFLSPEFWRETVSSLVREVGPERVLFGSDFPFVRPAVALGACLALDLADREKEMILCENAKALLAL
jgi:predicted TIM-barrel fold metal-dependent hydrolase